jgi:hypothetical protein
VKLAKRGVSLAARRPMERQMSPVYADGEVVGGEVLNLAVIAAALFVIVAALWSPSLPDVATASASPVAQVVASVPPAHAS